MCVKPINGGRALIFLEKIMKDKSCIKEMLSGIGLTESEITRFTELADNKQAQVRLLNGARYKILSAVHEREKKIQQIDYLIYEINKS